MSWHFSRALVEAYSAGICSDGGPSAPSSASAMQQTCWSPDKTTEACRHSRSGMTCAPLTADRGAGLLAWCLAGSLVRTSASPETGLGSTVPALGSGGTWRGSLARYDLDSRLWKTPQLSLLEASGECSVTWPSSGSMLNGACSERMMLVPTTDASGYGFLPTPAATRWTSNKGGAAGRVGPERLSLDGMAIRGIWPTPTASDSDRGGGRFGRGNLDPWPTPTAGDANASGAAGYSTDSGRHSGTTLTDAVAGSAPNGRLGRLNPTWVEWLMGWPLGWTDCAPLETGRFLEWRQQHSSCCEPEADGR
jgi:hypothetical protein